MYLPAGPDTLWLDLTNILLGLVTLLCTAVVGAGVVVELMQRLRVAHFAEDDHVLAIPDLGVTMPGGDERLDRDDRRTAQGVGRGMS